MPDDLWEEGFWYTQTRAREPPLPDVAGTNITNRCAGCGSPLPFSDYLVYKGRPYHERCLPAEARKVATRVR